MHACSTNTHPHPFTLPVPLHPLIKFNDSLAIIGEYVCVQTLDTRVCTTIADASSRSLTAETNVAGLSINLAEQKRSILYGSTIHHEITLCLSSRIRKDECPVFIVAKLHRAVISDWISRGAPRIYTYTCVYMYEVYEVATYFDNRQPWASPAYWRSSRWQWTAGQHRGFGSPRRTPRCSCPNAHHRREATSECSPSCPYRKPRWAVVPPCSAWDYDYRSSPRCTCSCRWTVRTLACLPSQRFDGPRHPPPRISS